MSTIAAAAQTADRIDYWIRRQSCYGTYPSQSRSKFNPSRDRRVGLSAIGQCLKDQYDAVASPMPPHIAALVEQLETVNRPTMYVQKPHWLDYDPLALAVLVIGIGIIELLVLII